MRAKTLGWIVGPAALATILAFDLLPGDVAQTPKFLLIGVLYTISFLVLSVPVTTWFLKRTTRSEDYQGTCPVGKVCPDCGAFTFAPRKDCRSCRRPLDDVEDASYD